jgi:hypothetical protein
MSFNNIMFSIFKNQAIQKTDSNSNLSNLKINNIFGKFKLTHKQLMLEFMGLEPNKEYKLLLDNYYTFKFNSDKHGRYNSTENIKSINIDILKDKKLRLLNDKNIYLGEFLLN